MWQFIKKIYAILKIVVYREFFSYKMKWQKGLLSKKIQMAEHSP